MVSSTIHYKLSERQEIFGQSCLSQEKVISNGTPRGSVLNPSVFFNINILIKQKKNKEYTFIFADELALSIFHTCKNKTTIKI